jgi:dihydropteroate synthase
MIKAFHCGRFVLDVSRPLIMGIVNLTDDSFSGDGLHGDVSAAIASGLRLAEEGAAILDIGAESSRPGATQISATQELQRILPVIDGLRGCGVPLSIDTVKPEVMREAIAAGADMINDIGALESPGALAVVALTSAAVCLMHKQGVPEIMQAEPHYHDVVIEVANYLAERVASAESAGIALNRICVDPGFGFGKTLEHNLDLLRHLDEMVVPGLPLLIGLSRKSMIGLITGRAVHERIYGSVAAQVLAIMRGARIVRVHDVAPMRDAIEIINAVEKW